MGFNRFLEAGLEQLDGPALVRLAADVELSPAQLGFLRSKLTDIGTPSAKGQPRRPEPTLSELQLTVLKLLSPSLPLPLRVLKRSLMLVAPPPPPLASFAQWNPYCSRFVCVCSLTFMATCVWSGQAALRLVARPLHGRT